MKKIVIFVCMGVLLAGSLFYFSCKSSDEEFDIRGTWDMNALTTGDTWAITFTGSKENGSLTDSFFGCGGSGTYAVNGTQVSFDIFYSCVSSHLICDGTVTNDNTMSGSYVVNPFGDTGYWLATR
jgi:hypothetical protein